MKKILAFCKKELILCIAFLLAVISCFFVKPDVAYFDYIDYHTLMLLFTLMVVMEGLGQQGVFEKIADVFLKRAGNARMLCFIMVFLHFFSAMLITNDVALLTFVPFTLYVLKLAGKGALALPIVILETLAANLGSMLTPVGNPQNLYLYSVSGMGIGDFLALTAPIAALSGLLLLAACFFVKKEELEAGAQSKKKPQKSRCLFFVLVFIMALLTVLKVLPVWIPFVVVILGSLLLQRKALVQIDYCLLLTFVSFFVFIGNVGRMEEVRSLLLAIMESREMLCAFFASQVISNVPAAILLSGFTDAYGELIKGTNIGGLGTLIASLASLISYKLFAQEFPKEKGKYFLYFTIVNIIFAGILLLFTKL